MVDERHPGASAALQPRAERILVVFPGTHRSWANWLVHRLNSHGQHATLQRWDPSRDQPLDEALGDLLLAPGRVLLVLSDWFFKIGPRPEGEWNAVLRDFVAPRAERFAAVNLTNRPLLPATAALEPVDLWGVGEEEAERRLLARLDLAPNPSPIPLPGPVSRYPNDPVAIWGDVPRRNREFTGRDDMLNAIQQRLTDTAEGASVCALVGMSGIGKTQLAAEYAHRFSPDYDVVWWVNSDQRNTQRERFGELAVELELTRSSEPGERIRAVRDALRKGRPYQRSLIVFDSWEESDEAANFLPRTGGTHVLITSRNRSWGTTAAMVEVSGFEREESTAYLMRRAPQVSAEDAHRVAAEFQDVPLQMAQAAALLGESGMDASEYLRMVRGGNTGHDDTGALSRFLIDYPESSLTSWSILINRLRKSEPHAVELLTLCSSFAAGRVPIGLARGLSPEELPEQLRWMSSDLPAWTRAMDVLVNYSVLTRDARAGSRREAGPEEQSVYMHRLVHGIVGDLTQGDDREMYRGVVRRLLAEADPGRPEDSRNWPRYAELLPHLAPSGALSATGPRVRNLLLNCLRYCFTGGEYRVGAELAERIREHWSENSSPDDPAMLVLTTRQGNILRSSGHFREAYALDSSRLERLRALPQADEEALLTATSCLAADQRYLGNYAEALQLQREVVTTAERLFGDDEATTLLACHNLATSLRLIGRYAEAYETDIQTLRRRETLLRARHPDTLSSGNACARDLRLMGRYQEALARQELGVRRYVQVLGPQHGQTLWARQNLVMCERRAGAAKQDTGTVLASLLEQQEQASGRGHFSTLGVLTDYGNYLRQYGDVRQAKDLIEEAEEGYRKLLGQAHPVPTAMQTNVGLILQSEGHRDSALNMFEQALAGLRTLLGDDHPVTLGAALNAAGGRNFTGRLESAAELSRDTLRRSRQVMGEDHPLTLSCQVALAADLRALQDRTEAGKLEEDALQRLARTLGAQHPHALSARQRVRPYWDFEPYIG